MQRIRKVVGNEIIEYTCDGLFQIIGNVNELNEMISPVKCNHCGQTYDLASANSTARFADCDVYKTPCCNTHADTREYKGIPDFSRINL